MVVPFNGGEIGNLVSAFEVGKSFIQTFGLQALSLLPLAHVSFLSARNARFEGTFLQGLMEKVVKDKSQLPSGAIVIEEFKDGEFMGAEHMTKSVGDDWAAAVHTDAETGWESSIGSMPYKGLFVPGTANLNLEEAAEKAKKLFKG